MLIPALQKIKLFEISCIVVETVSFMAIVFSYVNIYRVIARQKRSVHAIGTIQGQEIADVSDRKKEKDKAFTIAIILGLFLVCYFPVLGLSLYTVLVDYEVCPTEKIFVTYLWVNLLVLVNSSINPIVYFLRSKDIRKAAKRVFYFLRIYGTSVT